MTSYNKAELAAKMDAAMENFHKELSGLRTGRASVNLLDSVVVDSYGSKMGLNSVASISVPESRLITVQVWDKSQVKAVEKAIADAGLGLNPQADGQLIRIPIPSLNEERRIELVKIAKKYAEHFRISVRNIRRDAMDDLKKGEKDKLITEDEHKKLSEEVQKQTDVYIAKIDKMLADKEKDIMQV